MSNISFIVKSRDVTGGHGRVAIGLLNSTRDMLTENELLKVLHTLKKTHYLDEEASVGFDYVLDFEFTGRDAFPYALDMVLG